MERCRKNVTALEHTTAAWQEILAVDSQYAAAIGCNDRRLQRSNLYNLVVEERYLAARAR